MRGEGHCSPIMQMKRQGGPCLSTELVLLATPLRDLENNGEAVAVRSYGATGRQLPRRNGRLQAVAFT